MTVFVPWWLIELIHEVGRDISTPQQIGFVGGGGEGEARITMKLGKAKLDEIREWIKGREASLRKLLNYRGMDLVYKSAEEEVEIVIHFVYP